MEATLASRRLTTSTQGNRLSLYNLILITASDVKHNLESVVDCVYNNNLDGNIYKYYKIIYFKMQCKVVGVMVIIGHYWEYLVGHLCKRNVKQAGQVSACKDC